ncbi:alpha/beta hydrolase [Bradyrhizobium brasilense]|uniref:alpha/beta fold hydrolase n=1 Tax=Bradyrhizobium brasilense TaxID=1419277 RepID=UPI0028775A98|nr:alpha/beta hydrolase [Bradyrhizobium brasilense]MCP3418670.1 alpha/beta hydrolase [Bradyrhizobium brasilense]
MYIRVNDVDLFASAEGDEKAPLILALHGSRGTSDHVSDFAVFKMLGDQFRVVAYDQRGFGRSQPGHEISADRLVDDLEEVRLQLAGNRPAIVIGFSYGGIIALKHALCHPGAVSHLVLIGCPLSHHFEETALSEFKRRCAVDAPAASVTMVEKMLRRGFDSEIECRIVQFALCGLYNPGISPEKALAWAADPSRKVDIEVHKRLWMGDKYDARPLLSKLQAKLLAISGELDWLVPPSCAEELRALVPNARYVVVPGVGHSCHREVQDAVLKEIREFLIPQPQSHFGARNTDGRTDRL